VVSGILIAEIARHFRNPLPLALRMPALALFVVSALFAFQYSPSIIRQAGWSKPIAAVALGNGETVLHSSWDGHYRTIARLNDADVGFLVDTGASLVLLRYEDAAAAGVDMGNLEYTLPVTTAGSSAFVAPLVLAEMTIGGVTLHHIRAAVAAPDMLHTSLLGMSFLEKLSETVISGDRMILRQ
jgi:aspartyl protease family protein